MKGTAKFRGSSLISNSSQTAWFCDWRESCRSRPARWTRLPQVRFRWDYNDKAILKVSMKNEVDGQAVQVFKMRFISRKAWAAHGAGWWWEHWRTRIEAMCAKNQVANPRRPGERKATDRQTGGGVGQRESRGGVRW